MHAARKFSFVFQRYTSAATTIIIAMTTSANGFIAITAFNAIWATAAIRAPIANARWAAAAMKVAAADAFVAMVAAMCAFLIMLIVAAIYL